MLPHTVTPDVNYFTLKTEYYTQWIYIFTHTNVRLDLNAYTTRL